MSRRLDSRWKEWEKIQRLSAFPQAIDETGKGGKLYLLWTSYNAPNKKYDGGIEMVK